MNVSSGIKKYLVNKQQEIVSKLELLNEEELRLSNSAPESQELGTYSWEAETASTKEAIKKQLMAFSKQIHSTLSKLKKGTYGFCEKCKGKIEQARLEILPTASLCTNCVI